MSLFGPTMVPGSLIGCKLKIVLPAHEHQIGRNGSRRKVTAIPSVCLAIVKGHMLRDMAEFLTVHCEKINGISHLGYLQLVGGSAELKF